MENLKSANRFVIVLGIVALLLACLALNGCESKTHEEVKPTENKDTTKIVVKDTFVHYTAAIKPLMVKYCYSCHGLGYAYPFDTYILLKEEADNDKLYERLFIAKDMPPTGSSKPTQAELNSIKKWISDGCKE